MKKLSQAVLYSVLFTIYGGSFVFLFTLVNAIIHSGSVLQAVAQTAITCFVLWLLLLQVMYDLLGMFEKTNQVRRKPDDGSSGKDGSNPKSGDSP